MTPLRRGDIILIEVPVIYATDPSVAVQVEVGGHPIYIPREKIHSVLRPAFQPGDRVKWPEGIYEHRGILHTLFESHSDGTEYAVVTPLEGGQFETIARCFLSLDTDEESSDAPSS